MADDETKIQMEALANDEKKNDDDEPVNAVSVNIKDAGDNNNDNDDDNDIGHETAELSMESKSFFRRKTAEEGAIQVFTPENFRPDLSDEQLEGLVKDSVGAKVGARVYRLGAFFLHAVLSVIIITYTEPMFHITKVLALGLAGMFITYFIHIYYLVGYSKEIYRIYSLSGIVPNWTTMPITYRQLIYKYEPIQSISEFSAIGGGIANQMLVVISCCAWMTVLTQTLNNIWFEKIWLSFANKAGCTGCEKTRVNLFEGSNGIDAIIMFVGTFGLVMIGIFELDPFSKTLQNGHMLGVVLGFGCPVGFSIQQIFAYQADGFADHKFGIPFAIICDVIAVLFAILWTCYYNKESDKLAAHLKNNLPKTKEEMDDAQKKVRALTIRNVVTESITLLAGSLTLCLWLWNYNDLNPSFEENRGVLPSGGPWKSYYTFISNKYKCSSTFKPFTMDSAIQYCAAPQ